MQNLFDYRCHGFLTRSLHSPVTEIVLIRLCPEEQFHIVFERFKKLFPSSSITALNYEGERLNAESLQQNERESIKRSSLVTAVLNFTLPVQVTESAHVVRFFKEVAHPASFVVDPLWGLFPSTAILEGEERIFKITSFLTPQEEQFLHDIVTDESLPEGKIVEIGRCTGGSTAIMALALKRAGRQEKLHSFDPVLYDLAEEQLKTHALEPFVHVHSIDSAEGERVWKQQKKEEQQLRFLFIDGDHRYEGALQDMTLWLPFLAQGGVVALHDYDNNMWRHDCHGVPRAVQKCIFESNNFCNIFTIGTMLIARRK